MVQNSILILAFLGVLILARLLHRKIRQCVGQRPARWIHAFIALLAGYYLIDAIRFGSQRQNIKFIIFWLGLFVVEWYCFFKDRIEKEEPDKTPDRLCH